MCAYYYYHGIECRIVIVCSIAAFIIVVCSIKMFRSAFTNPSHQFFIVVFTMLFFRYDYAELSESFLVDYFFVSILLNKASCILCGPQEP